MANVINTALNNTGQIGDGLIITVYDKFVNRKLTDMPVFRQGPWLRKFPVAPTNKGRVIELPILGYFPTGAREIDEVISPDSVAHPKPEFVTVTMLERGLATGRSWLLEQVEYTSSVDEHLAFSLAKDAADTHDALVRDVLLTGTNRISSNAKAVSSQADGSLDNTDVMSAALVRYAVTELRVRNVEPVNASGDFVAIFHPYQSSDLRSETGAAAWTDPVLRNDAGRIWNGHAGKYEGAVILESNRAPWGYDGAASSTDNHAVYTALFLGREAVAEANKKEIGVGLSPMVDKFNRGREIYWHSFMGFAKYRDEAIQKVATGSSRGLVG